MDEEFTIILAERSFIQDVDIDAYLTFVDYEICADVEKWLNEHLPTAKIHRLIKSIDNQLHLTYTITFASKGDQVFYQLSQ